MTTRTGQAELCRVLNPPTHSNKATRWNAHIKSYYPFLHSISRHLCTLELQQQGAKGDRATVSPMDHFTLTFTFK